MGSPDFWNNQESAQAMVQQVKALKNWVDPFESLVARVGSAKELAELLGEFFQNLRPLGGAHAPSGLAARITGRALTARN